MTEPDLDAYCRRIGYAGPRAPTLEALRAIHGLHPQAIAFENLDPLLDRPVRLDLESLERKLVRGGRGGYCFEHNLLLAAVLRAIGFRVTPLAGRVLWGQPEDAVTMRSHVLLRIDLDGDAYIADVCFGGLSLTAPLRLAPDVEQATRHESFRVARAGDDLKLQAKLGADWKTLYRFDLHEQRAIDYEVANYYVSTHPDSLFRHRLLVARAAADRRTALRDNAFAIHHRDGRTEHRTLDSAPALRAALVGEFGLTLPDSPELDAALARVLAQAA